MLLIPVGAQPLQPNILRVDFYRVKVEHVTEFETAAREHAALLKKAGTSHGFSIWRSESGEREYVRVDAYSNYTELATNPNADIKEIAADRTRLVAAIDSRIENTRRLIVRVIPGASLPVGTELPPMITITWMRTQLGKGGEFQALAKSGLLPLMKKAGMKFFFVAQTVFGGASSDYAIVTALPSWAALDGPGPFDVHGRRSVPALSQQEECANGEPRGERVSLPSGPELSSCSCHDDLEMNGDRQRQLAHSEVVARSLSLLSAR